MAEGSSNSHQLGRMSAVEACKYAFPWQTNPCVARCGNVTVQRFDQHFSASASASAKFREAGEGSNRGHLLPKR